MKDFIEQRIIEAVRKLLTVEVNELLGEMYIPIPLIELSDNKGSDTVSPVISLLACEQSEKERIVKLEAYSVTITFEVPETKEAEMYCYAYAETVSRAFYDNPTLDGIVDRAVIIGKKYQAPKKPHCGENWGLIITLRLTIEGLGNAD